jgi:Carboxypeptidase regulatory-like domain
MLAKSLVLSFVGSLLVAFSVSAADTSALEGIVKDSTGRPIKGADVRIETKNFSEIVKTDANGHYVAHSLAVGTYKVTLVVDGQVKASILDAKTQLNKATQLNFGLTGKTASARNHTHMVWIPPDINTRIGGGHWVEVDDNGNIVGSAGVSNVERVTGPAVQQMQIRVSGAH